MDQSLFRVLLTVMHLLLLGLALFLLRALQRHLLRSTAEHGVKCPTYLAAMGEYQAPPRGWQLFHLMIKLLLPSCTGRCGLGTLFNCHSRFWLVARFWQVVYGS